MAIEDTVQDQIGERNLDVESIHHKALGRHVLNHVVGLPTVIDDSLSERTNVKSRRETEFVHLAPHGVEVWMRHTPPVYQANREEDLGDPSFPERYKLSSDPWEVRPKGQVANGAKTSMTFRSNFARPPVPRSDIRYLRFHITLEVPAEVQSPVWEDHLLGVRTVLFMGMRGRQTR